MVMNDKQNNQLEIPESQNNQSPRHKWFWLILSILSFIYVFIPEFTDTIPILGWMDEGIAIAILSYSLQKLGIRIPILDRILNRKAKKSSENQ